MKKTNWNLGAIALMMVSLIGTGCSTGGSDSDGPDTDITALVGTWVESYDEAHSTYTDRQKRTVTVMSDGTYTELYTSEHV